MQKTGEPTFTLNDPYDDEEVQSLRIGDWLRGRAFTYSQKWMMDPDNWRYNRAVEGRLVKIVLKENRTPLLTIRKTSGEEDEPIPYPGPGSDGTVYLQVWRASMPLDELSDDEMDMDGL